MGKPTKPPPLFEGEAAENFVRRVTTGLDHLEGKDNPAFQPTDEEVDELAEELERDTLKALKVNEQREMEGMQVIHNDYLMAYMDHIKLR